MATEFDFKEFENYTKAVTKFSGEFHGFLKYFLGDIGMRVINRAKPRTPVDTGLLRRSFVLGDVRGSGEDISVEILNGTEYASHIEYGHRIVRNGVEVGWYDGRFMLKTSVDDIRRQMPARYERDFANFCSKMGIA